MALRNTKQAKWELIGTVPGNHRFFRHENGGVSACDNSGADPDKTDDGPLWVLMEKPIVFDESNGYSNAGAVAVRDQHGDRYSILSSPAEIIWLVKNLGMRVEFRAGEETVNLEATR
jgi:hypothetical protein